MSRPCRSPIPVCGQRDVDTGSDLDSDPFREVIRKLTPRRMEILRLVARGLTNREIGGVLHISAYTVKAHMAALFSILDVTNRTEAAIALQHYELAQSSGRVAPDA